MRIGANEAEKAIRLNHSRRIAVPNCASMTVSRRAVRRGPRFSSRLTYADIANLGRSRAISGVSANVGEKIVLSRRRLYHMKPSKTCLQYPSRTLRYVQYGGDSRVVVQYPVFAGPEHAQMAIRYLVLGRRDQAHADQRDDKGSRIQCHVGDVELR